MTSMIPALQCGGLRKAFGQVAAVAGVDLTLEAGQFLALLGPSGCGKTTVLRLIAGFEQPDAGTITIAGQVVVDARNHVPPERRRIGMVFQDYALFPHLDVAGNAGFGLPNGQTREARIQEVLELVGLAGLGARYPLELSGGQQQRVALARALGQMRRSRRWGNLAFTAVLCLLTGRWILDGQTGFRAFSARALARAEILHDYNYAQVLTLDLLRKRMRLAQVPIAYRTRQHGLSFIKYREYLQRVLPAMALEILRP